VAISVVLHDEDELLDLHDGGGLHCCHGDLLSEPGLRREISTISTCGLWISSVSSMVPRWPLPHTTGATPGAGERVT
jgi:hypothetical protein